MPRNAYPLSIFIYATNNSVLKHSQNRIIFNVENKHHSELLLFSLTVVYLKLLNDKTSFGSIQMFVLNAKHSIKSQSKQFQFVKTDYNQEKSQ